MKVDVSVDVPDPRFKKGMLIVCAEGTFYVHDVRTVVPTSTVTGAMSSAPFRYEHIYELVVQKSTFLRPGSVVLDREPSEWVSRCRVLQRPEGPIVAADSIATMVERARSARRS